MGISDDIVPKRVYRARPKESIPAEKVYVAEDDPQQYEEDLSDNNEAKKPDGFLAKFFKSWLIWLLIIGTVSYLIYRNFNSIKGSVDKLNPLGISAGTSSSKDETYTAEIKPQDYTTSSSSSSQSASAGASSPKSSSSASVASTLKIQVLNGSGVSSAASTMKKALTDQGYTVASTGNAKSFTYEQTTIFYKTGKDAEATEMKGLLTSYDVILKNADATVGSYDIIVVVGKK